MSHNSTEEVVAQCLELLGFFVRRNVPYTIARNNNHGQSDIDLLAVNLQEVRSFGPVPFILRDASDLLKVRRASIGITSWLTTNFAPSEFKRSPRIFNFAQQDQAKVIAHRFLGPEPYVNVLVLPSLGNSEPSRIENMQLIIDRGVHHVLLLEVVASILAQKVTSSTAFASDVVQAVKLLKEFGRIK